MSHTRPPGRLVVLCLTLSVLACSVLQPGPTAVPVGTEAPPATVAAAATTTPAPSRTPLVFLTNTAVPRITPTPGPIVEAAFGIDRRETLVLIGNPPTPATLDPALNPGAADGYVGHLFSGLVRLSPALAVEPDLAESWTTSPDGLIYTFTLRPGLVFASGKPLTAADVAYSWERATDPATGSPTAATYLGDIAGVTAKMAGEAETIAGLAVTDDRTLAVTLAAPRQQFLAKLTYPVAFVVDQENVETGENWVTTPNASGPFTLRSVAPNDGMVFERNPVYHTAAGVQYVAYLFAPLELVGRLYAAGEIDIGFVDAQTSARVRDESDPLSAEWRHTTSLCTITFRLDLNRAPLDDPQVAQALVLALDRDGLSSALGGTANVKAETILPPDMPGHSADLPRFAFDPDQARALLAASRYAGQMPPLVLADLGTAASPTALGVAVADMWRTNLGLEVSLEPLQSGLRPATPDESHGHAMVFTWCADYPDPENFLEVMFFSTSEFNVSSYTNPQVDEWLISARAEPDPAVRQGLFKQVETQVLADVAAIPWLYPTYERLVKPYVQGYVLAPMGAPVVHLVTLDWPGE